MPDMIKFSESAVICVYTMVGDCAVGVMLNGPLRMRLSS